VKHPPVSAPNFYQDFKGLVTYAEGLKAALSSDNTFDVEHFEKDIGVALGNIRHDILQG